MNIFSLHSPCWALDDHFLWTFEACQCGWKAKTDPKLFEAKQPRETKCWDTMGPKILSFLSRAAESRGRRRRLSPTPTPEHGRTPSTLISALVSVQKLWRAAFSRSFWWSSFGPFRFWHPRSTAATYAEHVWFLILLTMLWFSYHSADGVHLFLLCYLFYHWVVFGWDGDLRTNLTKVDIWKCSGRVLGICTSFLSQCDRKLGQDVFWLWMKVNERNDCCGCELSPSQGHTQQGFYGTGLTTRIHTCVCGVTLLGEVGWV